MTKKWSDIRRPFEDDPEFMAEYRRVRQRMADGRARTDWMRRIPVVGDFVRVFWFLIYTEGWRQTLDPHASGLTFSYLNDGMKPTLWHTWHQVTQPDDDPYVGIYPNGAPRSLAEAQDRAA
jgi:hypothetical protein